MDIVFLGTADFACPSLAALASAREHKLLAVVTQPDRPAGRDLKPTPPPVKQLALKHDLPILQPERIKTPSFVATLRTLSPELIVVIAYGQILPKDVLALPKHGCVNVHGSLLPKYRGASPVQSALLHGERETGVTTMFMDEGLDTGDIILQAQTPIADSDNASTLQDRLAEYGAKLLLRTIGLIADGNAPRQKQDDSQATACKKIKKEDGRLDWNLPARELWNRVRAFTPWPSAYCFIPTPRGRKLLKIWQAAAVEQGGNPGAIARIEDTGILVGTGHGSLLIRELQLEGGRRLSATEFVRGHTISIGTVLE
jgi:methionyl-tRNA formyltransferase